MTRDYLAEQVGWLDDIFTSPENNKLFNDENLIQIQSKLNNKWKTENRLSLIKKLCKEYGEESVISVLDRIIFENCKRNWTNEGKVRTNSINNFINILWEPLKESGFLFSYETIGNITQFKVTKCPMYNLAKQINATKWFYHLVCLTDEPSIIGFNNKIEFKRTKTLMQGNSYCDHCYIDHSV